MNITDMQITEAINRLNVNNGAFIRSSKALAHHIIVARRNMILRKADYLPIMKGLS